MIQISGNITADGVDADQREKLLEDNRSKDVQEEAQVADFLKWLTLPIKASTISITFVPADYQESSQPPGRCIKRNIDTGNLRLL